MSPGDSGLVDKAHRHVDANARPGSDALEIDVQRGVLDGIELNLTRNDTVGGPVQAQIVHAREELAATNGQRRSLKVKGNVLRLALSP